MSAANFKLADALCHTDVYPVRNGEINLRDLPTTMLYEDDACADYMLFFARTEVRETREGGWNTHT